jgi:lipoic acid synthetase
MADTLYQIMGRHRMQPLPERKPPWLKVKAPGGANYVRLKHLMRDLRLHTVCEEAHCPNVGECWEHGTATFMILGDVCTRNCAYCAVAHGRPPTYDVEEPARVAQAIAELELRHAVITSVDRDDLPDFGAYIFAETIRQVKRRLPECSVEVLVPDFQGNADSIRTVLAARPDIYNHNTETVPRLYKRCRPGGRYERVLDIFRLVRRAAPDIPTKTGVILGMGETNDEVLATMRDLRAVGVDILTLGQYLRPSSRHIPLDRYVTPDEFAMLREAGRAMGFRHVESGPLVRSSYHAWEQVQQMQGSGARGRGVETSQVPEPEPGPVSVQAQADLRPSLTPM